MVIPQRQNCFRDQERPCTALCAAYNETPLNGTNCIELHSMHAQADGLHKLAAAAEGASSTFSSLMGMIQLFASMRQ